MSDGQSAPCILSLHIQKLGHHLEEIRVRSLNNILSKLHCGIISTNDLIIQRDLALKLLNWFNFETCPEKEKVLNLILLLLKTDREDTFHKQIAVLGDSQIVSKLRPKVTLDLFSLIDEISAEVKKINGINSNVEHFTEQQISVRIIESQLSNGSREILESDQGYSQPEELFKTNDGIIRQETSQRSSRGKESSHKSQGTTATPIYIDVVEQPLAELQSRPPETAHQHCHGYFSDRTISDGTTSRTGTPSQRDSCFQYLILPWQPLISTDCHVLVAVEESLSNTMDLNVILHTCQFFTDVMLQDFPAEVFLQRPAILKMFLELLDSDKRVIDTVSHCLYRLTLALSVRIQYYSDPAIANLKQEAYHRPESNLSTPSYQSAGSAIGRLASSPSHLPTDSHNSAEFHGYQRNESSNAEFSSEPTEDSVLLQLQQLTLPQYCLLCLFHIIPHIAHRSEPSGQNSINYSAILAAELVNLLGACVKPSIWRAADTVAQEVVTYLNQVFNLLGEFLEKHRNAATDEANRLTYLQLLALTHKILIAMVPVEISDVVLDEKLRNSLAGSLIDLSVITLFPTLHSDALMYVKEFRHASDVNVLRKYEDVMNVCSSMKAAVKFLKQCDKLDLDVFKVLDESLPSLPFHGNISVVENCINIVVNKLPSMELDENCWRIMTGVILKLLAHSDQPVRLKMYEHCYKCVMAVLGGNQTPRLSAAKSSQLSFLCNTQVLIEIICHGASSLDKEIKQYGEEILIHLLKGKVLFNEVVWRQFLESLIPTLPLLQCYADQTTTLGRAIVKIFDPETSQSIHMPIKEVLKGNLRLLFCADPLSREEAVSRLTWLMSREERAFEKLPDFSSLRGLLLNSICLMDRPIDLGHSRTPTNLYTNNLCQVLELLHSKGVEPVVRRSALTQICVMLEEPSLHEQFLENNGTSLVLDVLHKALVDKEFNDYPDSVIPCIGILKSLALYNSKLRFELSQHTSLFSCILRAIYLYNGDDRMRPDSSVLLCLLLYSDFIIPVPEPVDDTVPWHRFSLPDLVARNVRLPFLCHTHWNTSPHTQPPARRELLREEGCSSLLRLYWNVEWFGGLEAILNWPAPPPNAAVSADQLSGFSRDLRLTEADLNCLKVTAMSQRCKQHMFDIQNATSHEAVMKSVSCLNGYLALNMLLNGRMNYQMDSSSGFLGAHQLETSAWWHTLPWSETFKRFLTIPPVSPEDQQLLVSLLKLLNLYLDICCMSTEEKCQVQWLTKILKDTKQTLPNLLTKLSEITCGIENQGSKSEDMCRETLQLVRKCSMRERDREDPQILQMKNCEPGNNLPGSWIHIINAISKNITFSDTQHFYKLAFLNWMLSCLAHLTGVRGWSKCNDTNINNLWKELISSLVELVTAFHCRKGGASIASFMGLSITRSAVLCMNHLLCEMQLSSTEKGWEIIWLCSLGAGTHAAGKANLSWLPSLWLSRDPVTRAAALQLVAGFCSTRKGCSQLLSGLPMIAGGVWGAGLSFLLEHEEASLVREQAALLLTNLSSHSVSAANEGATLSMFHLPIEIGGESVTGIQAVLSILMHCNLYGEIAIILSRLYMRETLDPAGNLRPSNWDVGSPMSQHLVTEEEVQTNQSNRNNDSNSSNGQQGSLERSESLMTDSFLEPYVRTTPALVRNICWFMLNLFSLSPRDAVDQINKCGLVRLLFSCLVADIPVEFSKDRSVSNMSLSMDIMEMYAAICSVLSKCVTVSEESHATFLQTHDCIHSLLALLDPSIYSVQNSQLVLLRNNLWISVFQLLTGLLSRKQGFEAVRDSLFHCGHGPYLETVINGVQDELHSNLCYSALSCLISLLSFEMKGESKPHYSLQELFDSNPEELSEKSQGKVIENESPKEIVPPLKDLHKRRTFLLSEDKNTIQRNKSSGISNGQLQSVRNQTSHENNLEQVHGSQGNAVDNRMELAKGYRILPKEITQIDVSDTVNSSSNTIVSERSESTIKTKQVTGEELCKELVRLYGIYSLQQGPADQNISAKGKFLVKEALMSLLAISKLAKKSALNNGLLKTIITQLRELHIKLALESVDNVIRTTDKKRVGPLIREMSIMFGLLTNFLTGDKDVKESAAELGLADLVHKLWVWCCAIPKLMEETLKMLATFTASCPAASFTLVLTTAVPGVGLRKTPSSLSLLHALVSLINREMSLVNRVYEPEILSLAFQVLTNACKSQECRNMISKSNLFQYLPKLHPSVTKKQKFWESIELIWLEFLSQFTFYSEGQLLLPKVPDAMDLLILLSASSKTVLKLTALRVLRNIAFNSMNRPRLLSSGEFQQMLHQKLTDGSTEEKTIIASIVWALVANNQKGKLMIKCSGIDVKLQEALNQKRLQTNNQDYESDENVQIFSNVLRIIYSDSNSLRKQSS